MPGGIYAQNPMLLERFRYIFAERAKADEEKRKKEEAEQKLKTMGHNRVSPHGRRIAGSRRRP